MNPRTLAERIGLTDHQPVWLLSLGLWCASIALGVWVLRDLDQVSTEASIPAWVIALAVVIAESWVVHLHFRSESGSFSFVELPLVLGLLFVDPHQLWLAMTIGAAVGLAAVRRQQPIKLAFNVGNLSLRTALVAVLYQQFLGGADPLAPEGWAAIALATTITSCVEVSAIAAVITLTEQRFRPKVVRTMLLFGVVVAAGNTVQGLITALLLVSQPASLVLLSVSTFVLFIAYRSYVSEREQREKVEFLYTSTRALSASNEVANAMSTLLEEAAAMFRAAYVELFLFPTVDAELTDETTSRFWLQDGEVSGVDATPEEHQRARELVGAAERPRIVDAHAPRVVLDYVRDHGLRDAMLGVLWAGERAAAVLTVADRLGKVSTFTKEDLLLFETLIQHAAVALENDQLAEAIGQLRTLERELAHQAAHDTLTGLANRSLLGRHLDEVLGGRRHEVTLLFIDLDDFKLVNDTMGHAAGDEVLVEASRRLLECIRPTDTAARLGGDEFAIVLLDTTDTHAVADRILQRLQEPYDLSGHTAQIGASIGVAQATEHSTASTLVAQADVAMYVAKERGKGSVSFYAEEMHQQVAQRQALRSKLRNAISDGDLRVYYQPVVDLATLRIVGAEALVRWWSPDGLITPDSFIPEAERSGLIIPIDGFVTNQVLDDLRVAAAAGHPDLWFTTNVSARSMHDPTVFATITDAVAAHRVDASSLVVEVTETALMRDPEQATAQLEQLRRLGVRVALDDFGTGYSSLAYLRRIPVDLLKIAQPFVTDLTGGDETFVRAMIDLAHTLRLEVVAEGIEDLAALQRLGELHAEYGQGYLLARPMPIEELLGMLDVMASGRPLWDWAASTN